MKKPFPISKRSADSNDDPQDQDQTFFRDDTKHFLGKKESFANSLVISRYMLIPILYPIIQDLVLAITCIDQFVNIGRTMENEAVLIVDNRENALTHLN